MPDYLFNEGGVRRIVSAVKRVEHLPPAAPAGAKPPRPPATASFWAQITGVSFGVYTWKKLVPSGGALVDASPAVTGGGARDVNGRPVSTGTKVLLTFVGYASGVARYLFVVPGPPGVLFRVTLAQTGGLNGNKTTPASWVYTAVDLDGVTVGTNLSPERARENGTRSAATMGTGYFNTAGTFVLAEAWEPHGTGSCT
jgi:hypothetical protein